MNITKRDIEYLSAVDRGLTHAEIGEELHVLKRSVGGALYVIYNKLQVNNSHQACNAARRLGLLPMRDEHMYLVLQRTGTQTTAMLFARYDQIEPFLRKRHGAVKRIGDNFKIDDPKWQDTSYSCSKVPVIN